MKKFFMLLSFLLSQAIFVSHAQPEIGDLLIGFCEGSGAVVKALSYELDPGVEQEFCVRVGNSTSQEVSVELSFVDATITNDDSQYKACKMAGEIQNFGQFVTNPEPLLVVPARGAVEKQFTLRYPEGFAGKSLGCLITKIVASSGDVASGATSEQGLFDIEVRKGNFIDVLVRGTIVTDLHLSDYTSSVSKNNDGQYSYMLQLVNSGNVSQTVRISRSLSGIFGFLGTKDFSERVILPGEAIAIQDELVSLPWYDGLFSLSYSIESQALFDFESDAITSSQRESVVTLHEASFFVFPWILLSLCFVVLLLVLLFFFLLLKKGKKQQEPQKKKRNTVTIKQRPKKAVKGGVVRKKRK